MAGPLEDFLANPLNPEMFTNLKSHCKEHRPYDLLHRISASLTPTGTLHAGNGF